MERTDVIAGIRAALAEILDDPLLDLPDDTPFFEGLGLDSGSVLELLALVEERLGVQVDAERLDIGDFSSVSTLADYFLRAAAGAAERSGDAPEITTASHA